MFTNYLKTMYRNALKNKTFTLINITGIAIGLAISILIFQYVSYELSYDDFHKNSDQIYRLEYKMYVEGTLENQSTKHPFLLAPTLKNELPGILEYCRFCREGDGILTYGDNKFKIDHHYFADASFLRIFSVPLVKGDPETALSKPFTAVISQSAARRIFGDTDPIGKSFQFDWFNGSRWASTVTGVFKDLPANSHLKFDFLFSFHIFNSLGKSKAGWRYDLFFNYTKLAPNTNPASLEAKIPEIVEKHIGAAKSNTQPVFHLQPLRDIYLHSGLDWWGDRNVMIHGDLQSIYIMAILAIIILLVVWFNYINLSTTKSLDRAKEVILRKVVGAERRQLIGQFLLESFLLNLLAIVAAIILVILFTPSFNRIFGFQSAKLLLNTPKFWLYTLLLLGFSTIISGLFPAFMISASQASQVLKGKGRKYPGVMSLRNLLMILQFSICITLIAGTIAFYKQTVFMDKQDLGINLDHIILIERPLVQRGIDNFENRVDGFIEELKRYPSTICCASTGSVPGLSYQSTWTEMHVKGGPKHTLNCCWVHYDFFDVFNMSLVAGRKLSRDFPGDRQTAVILNEKAITLLGFENPEKAINQILYLGEKESGTIIGVVKNYHQESLKKAIEPVMFRFPSHFGFSYLSVKLNTENYTEAVKLIKEKWDEYFPGNLFIYHHMKDFFDKQYYDDRIFVSKLIFFTSLAIILACLGLLGLSLYTTLQRTKEIGIRKVYGASIFSVVRLFLKDLTRLLIIAILIAAPLAYWVFNKLLEDYAYRIQIGWWFFVIPVLIIIPFILVTVIYQIVRAASGNPVDALRYE